jgi:CMP-N-acetylneuraminic acid synthetase
MRVLGIIPARGGSKGVARKNVRALCGRPLLAYTADAALSARCLSRVVLTTEDEEIARIGRECGLEVPFMRPAELAADDTPMLPVVRHAILTLEDMGDCFDAICLLQPTNPLRDASLIDACIELLAGEGADSVVTVLPVPHEHNPHWVYFRDDDGALRLSTGEPAPIARRQDLPPAFHREGSVYVTRRDVVVHRNSLYGDRLLGLPVEPERCVNIDSIDDWHRAERLVGAVKA